MPDLPPRTTTAGVATVTAATAAKRLPPDATPAQMARFAAGLSVEEAARCLNICVAYLRRLERRGAFPFVLAVRAAREYGCGLDVFAGRYVDGKTDDPESQTTKEGAKTRERPERKTRERRLRKGGDEDDSFTSPALSAILGRKSR